MAEKTGMNIKADATIVGAAGNLASAMKPFDMSDMAEGLVESHKDLMDSMAENFKSVLKKIDIADSGLQEVLKVMRKKMNSGDLTPKQREELQAKMEDYRARWKAIPWGKKGKQQRNDLLYEINREIKTTKDREAAALDVLSTLESGTYDAEQLDAPYLEFLDQIVRSESEQETSDFFFKEKNKNGEWVYSYTYKEEDADGNWVDTKVSGTIYDIQEKLNNTKKDYGKIGEVNEFIYGYEKYAKDNPNAKFEDIYNRIWTGMENSFNQDEAKFRSTINHNVGWSDKSYVETLRDVNSAEFQNIVKILSDMNDLEFDFNEDGEVNEDDFKGSYVTEENINEMIRVLTKPEAGEKRIAYEAAAKFYADTEARKAFGFGVDNRPKDNKAGDSGSTLKGKKYGGFGAYQFNTGGGTFGGEDRAPKSQTWKDAQTKRDALDELQTVRGTHSTYTWDEDKRMYISTEGDEFTRGEVAAIEGVMKTGENENSAVFAVLSGDSEEAAKEEARDSGQITSSELTSASGDTAPGTAVTNLNSFYGLENKPIRFERPGWFERSAIGGIGNMIAFAGPDGKRYQLGELLTGDQIQEFYELFPYPKGAGGTFSKNAPIHTMPNSQTGGEDVFSDVRTGALYINTGPDYRDDATKAINWLMENSRLLNPYMKDVTTVESVESNSGTYD